MYKDWKHLGQGDDTGHRHNQQYWKIKWSWEGHINRLKYDRRTSCVITWRSSSDKKRRQGRPATRWRDDDVKYWSDSKDYLVSDRGQHKTG